ncbi:Uncharacterised protein [Enterobacter hormaechei]|nr:Uncharacterised protein [Enterobacter hormaechei]
MQLSFQLAQLFVQRGERRINSRGNHIRVNLSLARIAAAFFFLHLLVVGIPDLIVGQPLGFNACGIERGDHLLFHRVCFSVGFDFVLSGFAHDFYWLTDQRYRVVIDEVFLLEEFRALFVDEFVRPDGHHIAINVTAGRRANCLAQHLVDFIE